VINRRNFLEQTILGGAAVTAARNLDGGCCADADPKVDARRVDHLEWTLEEAKALWKPMTRAVQHVGVPGYDWQCGVLWDGSLLFGPLNQFRYTPALAKECAPLGRNLLNVAIGFGDPPRFTQRAGIADPNVQRRLEGGRLPIPHIQTRDGGLLWEETVFAHLLDRKLEEGMIPSVDDVLVVHARFKIRNSGAAASVGHLWLHFGETSDVLFGYKAGRSDEMGPVYPQRFEAPLGILENRWLNPPFGSFKKDVRYVIPPPPKGKVTWHPTVPPPPGMKNPAECMIEWRIPLAAAEQAEFWVSFPYGPVDRPAGQKMVQLRRDQLWTDVRDFWKNLVDDSAGSISTPDAFVNDYLAAVVGQMTQQIAFRHVGKIWMYKTSPNWYEIYWPVSAAWPLPTLDLRGLTQYSRPVLQSFIDTQTDDIGGLNRGGMGKGEIVKGEGFAKRPGFLGNFGDWTANTLLLSHGLELWALASHYRITRDRQWLEGGARPPLQALLDACDWITTQRRRTMREENGRKVRHWGLLPAASTHDWLQGNTIANDSTCIYGMVETVRLLREIDHPRAEELAKEVNDYRACLRERYGEARDRARRVPMDDGTEIPYVPRDVYELDWAETDWTYTCVGPPRAGAWGALDPHDELVDQSLAFIDAGLPRGPGYYLRVRRDDFQHPTADENFRDISNPAAPRHYYCRHYVEYETMIPIFFDLFLQRDDLPRFFAWLFNNLAVTIHRDFRVGVESLDGPPSCAPGDGIRWQAMRAMFVNERGGYDGSQQSLWLLQAVPRAWLQPGASLEVKRLGSHFGGRVDLSAQVAGDGNSIDVRAHLDLAVRPRETRLRLRSGDGRRLAAATVNGASMPVLEDDTIQLPRQVRGDFAIVGMFRPEQGK
jgi:hypothetical protein